LISWHEWKKRLSLERPVRSAHFLMPTVALELEPGFVAGARLDAASRQVQRVGVRELQAGALAPSPSKPNIADDAAVRRTIAEVAELVGDGGGKLGLLIPDASVRVALLQFETLPEGRREAESLVRWRMREFLPFAPEEARVSYQTLVHEPSQVEILALAVRGSVLAEYEATLEGLNGGATLILPATVALLPLLPEDAAGELLLHLCPGALTAVVVVLNRVRYWRTRVLDAGVGRDSHEEIAREAARVLATCQDHLKVPVQNIWFCARPPATAGMKDALARILGRELRPLVGSPAQASALPGGEREALQHFGTPFAGLLANLVERR
jgi:type IV pilus assembly protein PilM